MEQIEEERSYTRILMESLSNEPEDSRKGNGGIMDCGGGGGGGGLHVSRELPLMLRGLCSWDGGKTRIMVVPHF